jgi:hypothetical protein
VKALVQQVFSVMESDGRRAQQMNEASFAGAGGKVSGLYASAVVQRLNFMLTNDKLLKMQSAFV